MVQLFVLWSLFCGINGVGSRAALLHLSPLDPGPAHRLRYRPSRSALLRLGQRPSLLTVNNVHSINHVGATPTSGPTNAAVDKITVEPTGAAATKDDAIEQNNAFALKQPTASRGENDGESNDADSEKPALDGGRSTSDLGGDNATRHDDQGTTRVKYKVVIVDRLPPLPQELKLVRRRDGDVDSGVEYVGESPTSLPVGETRKSPPSYGTDPTVCALQPCIPCPVQQCNIELCPVGDKADDLQPDSATVESNSDDVDSTVGVSDDSAHEDEGGEDSHPSVSPGPDDDDSAATRQLLTYRSRTTVKSRTRKAKISQHAHTGHTAAQYPETGQYVEADLANAVPLPLSAPRVHTPVIFSDAPNPSLSEQAGVVGTENCCCCCPSQGVDTAVVQHVTITHRHTKSRRTRQEMSTPEPTLISKPKLKLTPKPTRKPHRPAPTNNSPAPTATTNPTRAPVLAAAMTESLEQLRGIVARLNQVVLSQQERHCARSPQDQEDHTAPLQEWLNLLANTRELKDFITNIVAGKDSGGVASVEGAPDDDHVRLTLDCQGSAAFHQEHPVSSGPTVMPASVAPLTASPSASPATAPPSSLSVRVVYAIPDPVSRWKPPIAPSDVHEQLVDELLAHSQAIHDWAERARASKVYDLNYLRTLNRLAALLEDSIQANFLNQVDDSLRAVPPPPRSSYFSPRARDSLLYPRPLPP